MSTVLPFFLFLLIAFVVETLVKIFRPIWEAAKSEPVYTLVAAELFGVGLAFMFSYNVFNELGLPVAVPYLGIAITGLIAGRGAQAVHDFLNMIQSWGSTGKSPLG